MYVCVCISLKNALTILENVSIKLILHYVTYHGTHARACAIDGEHRTP